MYDGTDRGRINGGANKALADCRSAEFRRGRALEYTVIVANCRAYAAGQNKVAHDQDIFLLLRAVCNGRLPI